jgi:hypothetical protein
MATERAEEAMQCPQCQGVLEEVNAMALFSMLPGEGYLCNACQILDDHDLKPWVRVI